MADKQESAVSPSDCETSGLSESSESLDFSCIHWGYLNCTHIIESGKKGKQAHSWQTCWVDLCGSTLRLYRDLSISPDSAIYPPPSSVIGPTEECQKKEAFIVLRQDAEVDIIDYEEESYKPRKKGRRENLRKHVFKLSLAGKGQGCLAYLFQAPSKSSLYRWISKIEEGIAHADKPLTESVTDKKLKEAKLLAMEQRRYQVPPEEMRYPDVNREDIDSGMEGDVEESFSVPQKAPPNPRLDQLRQLLKQKEELLEILEQEERDFTGGAPENPSLSKVCQFQATTKVDYFLVQGYPATLVRKGTTLTVFGQLPNGRWRCCVDVPVPKEDIEGGDSAVSSRTSSSASLADKASRASSNLETLDKDTRTELLIGSVPSSLLVELDKLPQQQSLDVPRIDVMEDGTPTITPDSTPRQLSPSPTPPGSPYSPHKAGERRSPGEKKPSQSQWRSFPAGSERGFLEHVHFPSPPSSAVSSRSSSPSFSLEGSLDGLDSEDQFDRNSMLVADADRAGEGSVGDVPVTYIGSESEDDRHVIVAEESREQQKTSQESGDVVKRRPKRTELLPSDAIAGSPKSYAFHVTRKLRQRGISLIVGSSSSEDEDDASSISSGRISQISKGRLDKEFQNFKEEGPRNPPASVRPYSTAFVPRQKKCITLPPQQKYSHRSATTDELLRDYSSEPAQKTLLRSSTCTTLGNAARWSVPLGAPGLNQRRTLQLKKDDKGGFGFTLQTYGIVQREGHVEYMTFVLDVQEDGPAYMAGLRPGDIIIEIGGQVVEDADHKTMVKLIQEAPSSIRMVAVFVDAIRKMKLNTRLKILKAKLGEKETEFDELSKKEQELLKGCGVESLELVEADITQRRGRKNSYLYTTELTSRFSKDDEKVEEHIRQFRQEGPDRARRISLPDATELDKQQILTTTTGNQMLRTFASTESFFRKASTKLQKSIKKKRPTSKTFTSYVDIDVSTENLHRRSAGSISSSLSSVYSGSETRLSQLSPGLTRQEFGSTTARQSTKEQQCLETDKLSAANASTEPNTRKKSDSGTDSSKPARQPHEVQTLLHLSKNESQMPDSTSPGTKVQTKADSSSQTHQCLAKTQVKTPVNINNKHGFAKHEVKPICNRDEASSCTRTEVPSLSEAAKQNGSEPERSKSVLSSSSHGKADVSSVSMIASRNVGKVEEGKQTREKENEADSTKLGTRSRNFVEVRTGDRVPSLLTNECASTESVTVTRSATSVEESSLARETAGKELSRPLGADAVECVARQGGDCATLDRQEDRVKTSPPKILQKPGKQSQNINKASAQGPGRLGSNIAQMRSRFETTQQPVRVAMKPAPKPVEKKQWKPPAK